MKHSPVPVVLFSFSYSSLGSRFVLTILVFGRPSFLGISASKPFFSAILTQSDPA